MPRNTVNTLAKKRTLKQKAATKKLVALNKRKAAQKKRKSAKKGQSRSRISQPLRSMPKKKSMAKKRRSRVRSAGSSINRGQKKFGGILKKGIIGNTVSALGASQLISLVTNRVAPQATPFAVIAGEYAAGGVTGMVAAEGLKSLTGQPSILTQVMGNFGLTQPSNDGGLSV